MGKVEALLQQPGPILLDGATGTELAERSKTRPDLHCLEEFNLSKPELVREIHRDYIAAGAQIIETNTFGANPLRLAEYGLEPQMKEINRRAAELAVAESRRPDRQVLVAGSIGPLGQPIAPLGSISRQLASGMYTQQIAALVEGGIDLLILETYTSLAELELAIQVALRTAPHLPLIAAMSFDQATPEAAQALLNTTANWPLTALGTNCGSGPEEAIEIVQHLVKAGASRVIAFPNAGLPRRIEGRLHYSSPAEYFASTAHQLVAAGAKIIGGCCGTGPRHIEAMHQVLTDQQSQSSAPPPLHPTSTSVEVPNRIRQSRLADQLHGKSPIFSVELRPPRGVNPKRILEGARQLQRSGVEFVNITDSAMARVRMGVLSCAALVQYQVGLEAIAHYTTRDRNVMAIQSELIGAHALGVRNVLCLRGDAPRIGDYPNATAVWDVTSVGLITILSNLNQGLDANGSPIGEPASFCIGTAFNPNAESMSKERTLLQRKLEAGADFIVTNPLFEIAAMERCLEVLAEIKVPILIGLMPLISARQANYLHHEVPGMTIPEKVRQQIEDAGEDAPQVGLELALELLKAGQKVIRGAYIVPGGERYDIVTELIQNAREVLSPHPSGEPSLTPIFGLEPSDIPVPFQSADNG